MIYLKPIGGLCNRIRSIDSIIELCKINKRDLTVLWVKDASLNSNFKDLFKIPIFNEFRIEVIDCPIGFPENYLQNPNVIKSKFWVNCSNLNFLAKRFKNILKGRILSFRLIKIVKELKKIKNNSFLTNDVLKVLYASDKYVDNTSIREMDANFITIVKPKISTLFINNERSAYISSCYRMHPLKNQYDNFCPVPLILNSVEKRVNSFNQTIGLHIRRSDHVASKVISTTEKFIKVIDGAIEKNHETSFFLSTDDETTKEILTKKYKEKIMINDITSYDRNNSNAIVEAMIDLYCLSYTKKIFGSHHSSFSQTAADIGGIKDFTVR